MSGIFSTIIENIKSFFQREEDLTVKPKAVPEAASEVFERPNVAPQPVRIIDKPLPEATRLPFSPDDLRSALKAKQTASTTTQEASALQQRPTPAVERDISREIAAFEHALHDAHKTVITEMPIIVEEKREKKTSSSALLAKSPSSHVPGEGFFDEFEEFLTKEGLEAEGVLDQDLLWRMKEFHRQRREGKEYYLYSKDVQSAIDRKLAELKNLEHEWFNARGGLDDLEKDLIGVEHEIESRTTELKELVKQAHSKSRLERAVQPGQEFRLADGRKLSSLLDLKAALLTMPDTVFSHHVSANRNDFAEWIRGAVDDAQIADEVAKARDKEHLLLLLGKLGATPK